MNSFGLRCYSISICAAVGLLAGCGGSQPPMGAPGAMPQTRTSSGYSLLYSFGAGTDGQTPKAGLIVSHRELYGTTYSGGANGMETVFKISTTGQEPVRSL